MKAIIFFTSLLALTLSAVTARAWDVCGVVKCPTGKTQAGILVWVVGETINYSHYAYTRDDGTYCILLPDSAASYSVSVDPRTLPNGATLSGPQKLSVSSATPSTTINFELSGTYCPAPSHIIGIVFCDANNNGVPDRGDSALPNVMVRLCDGRETLTDTNGYYQFENVTTTPCDVAVVRAFAPSPCNNLTPNCPTTVTVTTLPAVANFCFTPSLPPPVKACQPVTSRIAAGFNGTSIRTNSSIWFNANFSAKGIPATGATIFFKNSYVLINGVSNAVPNGIITFSPQATCATTVFSGGQWLTTLPVRNSEEILLSAFALQPTTDLKGASVTWVGDFNASASGISLSWKWGAAVYGCLSGMDYNNVLVKPARSNVCGHTNSDHVGTPQNIVLKKCVLGGARGGGGANYTGSWSGTASVTPSACPLTIWPSSTLPGYVAFFDPDPVELGVKFVSDVPGFITGIRYFKSTSNTDTHVGNLWDSTGNLLASATFAAETASGWQQVRFATPVVIAANTVYVASYHTPTGNYNYDPYYFQGKGVDNSPLRALADEVAGGNGVFRYGATSSFPNQTYRAHNYWVDVLFSPH